MITFLVFFYNNPTSAASYYHMIEISHIPQSNSVYIIEAGKKEKRKTKQNKTNKKTEKVTRKEKDL